MARTPTLTFDRGTLLLHPPPRGKAWIDYAIWDDRVERFRILASSYRRLVQAQLGGWNSKAPFLPRAAAASPVASVRLPRPRAMTPCWAPRRRARSKGPSDVHSASAGWSCEYRGVAGTAESCHYCRPCHPPDDAADVWGARPVSRFRLPSGVRKRRSRGVAQALAIDQHIQDATSRRLPSRSTKARPARTAPAVPTDGHLGRL